MQELLKQEYEELDKRTGLNELYVELSILVEK